MNQKTPTDSIVRAHAAALENMPFEDTTDFKNAERGFLGTFDGQILSADGNVVWDLDSYSFITGDAPLTVHPSLWRQSKLVAKHGLFEVVEGIYQVRGFDLSNVTFVESGSGVIVIDPLISTETAAAALELYKAHRGDRRIVAVIYTHSHVDHFGGVFGVVSEEDVKSGQVQIIAPDALVEHAVAENILAGTAMSRRAGYMYGAALAIGPDGQVGAGLGQTTSKGEVGIIVPTLFISKTGEMHTVDGIEIEFQMAPNSEAPSEMHFYFPKFKAFCAAENATHTLHNLLTLRGALVRDPHVWSGYLTEAIKLYGQRTEVVFASHHWPIWGEENAIDFLGTQRDLYAYLHDQTLRLINKGYTGPEIAEIIQMPPALERAWNTHGYYGSVSHNVKAVYQRYMGWFDGNPARLWPHPPAEQSKRYVDAMGGIDRVVDLAKTAYDAGDFRWAATLLDHVIFTDPDAGAARELYADTLVQLAYGAENGTWRNFFLSGATELLEGSFGTPAAAASPAMMAQLTPSQLFDALAVSVDGPKAWDLHLKLDITLSDREENYRLTLKNGVLIHELATASGDADAQFTMTMGRLLGFLTRDFESPGFTSVGNRGALAQLLGVLDQGDPNFNIVTP